MRWTPQSRLAALHYAGVVVYQQPDGTAGCPRGADGTAGCPHGG